MLKPVMGKFESKWKKVFDGAELAPSDGVWNAIDSRLWLTENSGFEKGWRSRFQNAELEPSENVWKAIDVDLVRSENGRMKNRVVVFQRLAAASIGVLIMFAAYSWLNITKENQDNLVKNDNSLTQQNNSKQQSENQNSNPNPIEDKVENKEGSNDKNQNLKSNSGKGGVAADHSVEANHATAQTINNKNTNLLTGNISNEKNAVGSPQHNVLSKDNYNALHFEQGPISSLEFVDVSKLPHSFGPNDYAIAYRMADARPAVITRRKPLIHENKWAAISFSAGTFSPGVGNTEIMESNRAISNDAQADLKSGNTPATKSENVKPGTSIAMAVSAGKRIFRKFILQGGVSYLNQTSASSTEVVAVAPANQVYSVSSFTPETTNTVTYQSLQEINSTFQFISVPVQLGYMLVDRKFGIQLNGGLSPDFFLKNSIYNETTGVEILNSAGENGTFNTVSVSGLGSIEFSYKFLNHYRVSLAPGVKYSITSIYNENTLASAKPFVADIGLRFRYIF